MTNRDDYQPVKVATPAAVLQNDRSKKSGGWADPEVMPRGDFSGRISYENGGEIAFADDGRPQIPAAPTGRTGRILGKWGPNQAADPLLFRRTKTGMEMLAIRRKDTGAWAIPGGMVDDGESPQQAAARELLEETGLDFDFSQATIVYQGIVKDDPRNTDNAWMEMTVLLLVLPDSQGLRPRAGDDAAEVKWLPLSEENLAQLYASHGVFVRKAIELAGALDADAA